VSKVNTDEKERQIRKTEATKMVEDFMSSRAKLAKVSSPKTENPYHLFITMRRNIVKLGLQDKVRTFVKNDVCYLQKL
jgi:hypothetical protein